ncbi:MAG TPA: amino acid ABC transporter substrate-binding protein [Desulfobulbaceae bacterium]|nr:amino acid ABC transporter substrate-binding protein [Desulfobulbaceae bacterium]
MGQRDGPFYVLSFFLVLVFLLPSCNRQQPPVPIKIGLAINLSGRGGTAGEHIRDGALLAVDKINSSGGINGHPLELLVRDDQNTADGIRKADESLLQEGVAAIVGHSTSRNTLIGYPVVTAGNILLITPYAATNNLTGKDDLFFRTSVDCTLYGAKTAVLLQRQKAQSVAFLMDMANSAFVLDYVDQVKKHFSVQFAEIQFNSRKETNWPEIIKALLAPKPDAVVLLTEASMSGVALQKLAAAGYSGGRFATIWADTPELLRYAGSSAEGLSIITFIDPENKRPDYLAFSREMEKSFHKKATARSSRAYEVVSILADALKRRKENTTDSLKQALLSGEYDTILGHLRFDAYGDVERPVYEVIVRDRQFRRKGIL